MHVDANPYSSMTAMEGFVSNRTQDMNTNSSQAAIANNTQDIDINPLQEAIASNT